MAFQERLEVATRGRGLVELTAQIERCVERSGLSSGLCVVFLRHTSAGLLLHENADPTARADLEDWLERIAPEGGPYAHSAEGPDDMPAHLRSVLTGSSLSIPVIDGTLALGTWQGIFLCEHRASPHRRQLVVHVS